MQNASLAYGFLIGNARTRHYIVVFQTCSGMVIKRISVRHA